MSLRDILVHIDLSKECMHRLDVASSLTRAFNAHLSGIYRVPDALIAAVMTTEYLPANFVAEQEKRERMRSKEARTFFEEYTTNKGITAEWRASTGAWRACSA